MLLTSDQWNEYFGTFKKSAFRLETHQTYTMPNEEEDFQRFLRGEPKPEDHNAAWHAELRSLVSAGKRVQRAKIVHRPFTDYTKYLLTWAIPDNVAAGEDYRIIDLPEEEIGLPGQDFWFFDERAVVHLNYREDGTQVSRELIEKPDTEKYVQWRDTALDLGIPFNKCNGT